MTGVYPNRPHVSGHESPDDPCELLTIWYLDELGRGRWRCRICNVEYSGTEPPPGILVESCPECHGFGGHMFSAFDEPPPGPYPPLMTFHFNIWTPCSRGCVRP